MCVYLSAVLTVLGQRKAYSQGEREGGRRRMVMDARGCAWQAEISSNSEFKPGMGVIGGAFP